MDLVNLLCKSRSKPKIGWIALIAAFFGYCFEFFCVSPDVLENSTVLQSFDLPPSTAGFKELPRFVQILNTDDMQSSVSRIPDRFRKTRRKNRYWIDHNDPEAKDYYHPRIRDEGCEPLGTWQDELHPSCNDFHEIAMTDLSFVATGNYRDTWMFQEYKGTKRALKMLRVLNEIRTHAYDYVNTERHRKDAVASMELSSSPYVANIYSYCSNSGVYDAADGHLWTIFNRPNKDGPEVPPNKDELFKFAHDAALAVAHTHHLDFEGRVTMVHGDLKPSQFIRMPNGEYKLNDFNRCDFASWKDNEYCKVEGDNFQELVSADILELGKLFNYMLRGKRPYDDPNTVTSPLNSTHPYDIYVKRAMHMCMRQNHASAEQVASFLHRGYTMYQETKEKMAGRKQIL